MNECDSLSLRADPRYFVDQANASGSAAIQCGVEIRYEETHVMQAWTASGDELPDGRVVLERLEQLDERIAGYQSFDARAIGVVEGQDG